MSDEQTPVGHSIVIYPRELPMHDLGHIIAHLRGQEVIPTPDLIQHCTTIIGCGAEYMKKEPRPVGAVVEVDTRNYAACSESELADELQAVTAPQAGDGAEAAIPWSIIVPILIDVVRRYFKF